MSALIMVLMFLTSLFLIMLVLVQRGRGGGLAGALGGMGGQSAFGTKAGDLFTRITIGVATVWILLCIVSVEYYNREEGFEGLGSASTSGNTPGQPAGSNTPAPPAGSNTPAPPAGSNTPAPPAGSSGVPLGEQPVSRGAPVSPLTNETPSESQASSSSKPATEKPASSAPAAPAKK